MPLSGAGIYSAPASSWNPAVDTTDINSTDWATLLADLSTALSTAMYKDGQAVATANIDFAQGITVATNKFTVSASGVTRSVIGLQGPYLYYREEEASGVNGGTFTAGAWRTRVLNTEVADTDNFGSVASNQITLAAGTYRFRASAPAALVNAHKIRLANITDTIYYYGTSENTDAATGVQTRSQVSGRFTIATSKVFEVQHYCQSTEATNGFGVASSFSVIEVYAEVEFWKEA